MCLLQAFDLSIGIGILYLSTLSFQLNWLNIGFRCSLWWGSFGTSFVRFHRCFLSISRLLTRTRRGGSLPFWFRLGFRLGFGSSRAFPCGSGTRTSQIFFDFIRRSLNPRKYKHSNRTLSNHITSGVFPHVEVD